MTQNTAQTLDDWLRHIESFHPGDIDLGLERILLVAQKLNLLTLPGKVITIGGTNGKGSCVAMLEALASEAGKKVAVYTSPHLVDFNERIRIGRQQAADDDLVKAFQKIEHARGDTALTFFEFTTLAALYIFKQQQPDLTLLEVGLGGRLDAVNIIDPDVSVITTIALDHTDWLGDSVESVAFEKAGIMRPQKTAIIGDQKSFELIQQAIALRGEQLGWTDKLPHMLLANKADLETRRAIDNSEINRYQLLEQNIMAAFTAYQCLWPAGTQMLKLALQQVQLQGRFQSLAMNRPTVVDVAHNPQSAANLAKQLKRFLSNQGLNRVVAICGMMKDKAIGEVFSALAGQVDEWHFTDLSMSRAATAAELQSIYQRQTKLANCQTHENVPSAYEAAVEAKKGDCLILVFGSFITVSNMIQYSQSIAHADNSDT